MDAAGDVDAAVLVENVGLPESGLGSSAYLTGFHFETAFFATCAPVCGGGVSTTEPASFGVLPAMVDGVGLLAVEGAAGTA